MEIVEFLSAPRLVQVARRFLLYGTSAWLCPDDSLAR
jgi:hypothetical protein